MILKKSRSSNIEGYFLSMYRELGIKPIPLSELVQNLEKSRTSKLDRYFSSKLKELGIKPSLRKR